MKRLPLQSKRNMADLWRFALGGLMVPGMLMTRKRALSEVIFTVSTDCCH